LINLVILELWKHFLDFKEFRNLIDFFRHFCQNRRGERRNISRFDCILTFIVDWSFGGLWVELGFDFISE